MVVDPIGARYPTPAALLQFYDAIEQEIRTQPGVRNVAWSSSVPLGDSYAGRFAFEIVGDAPVDAASRPTAAHEIVSATYFDTLDLPVVAGRGFDVRDTRQSVPVCVVSEALVRKSWAGDRRSACGWRYVRRPHSPSVRRARCSATYQRILDPAPRRPTAIGSIPPRLRPDS